MADMQVAVGDCACCPCIGNGAGLDGPLFQPFFVAPLNDEMDWSAAKAAVHAMLLACCPKGSQ